MNAALLPSKAWQRKRAHSHGGGKKPRNGAYTRNRGYRFENETVNALKDFDLRCERIPLSGAGLEKGDIKVWPGFQDTPLVGELKRKKALPTWVTGPMAGRDFLAMREDSGETLVVIRLKTFAELIQ